ncbi:DUF1254 domain-containing protein [Palleronia sp. KMU-117]|uniref:DUF1254 domain-containing protein n=1 Tax=Palleronia sp. KMU-117 TaxID=3434108 RepID=UPI003D70CB3E
MKRRTFLQAGASAIVLPMPALGQSNGEDIGALAREAYIYTYPMVENYLSIYQFALDPTGDQYKGPPNAIHNVARVFTPEDRGVVTPNSDTPYSFLIMDLRAEPLVVSLPPVEADRYYSLQIVDLYSHNVDYVGTRLDGNGGGNFLIAGPGWTGEAPEGIVRTIRIPTQIVYSQFRTQLYDDADLDRVREIQAGYGVQPLSSFVGAEPPPAPPAVDWPRISRDTAQPDFWSYANFLLQFAPPLPWEEEVRNRFAAIGVAPAIGWPATDLPDDLRSTVVEAGDAALVEIQETLLREVTSSRGLFGSPEAMRGKYMQRALGAMGGLYGLEEDEALYETYLLDSEGKRLDSSTHDYVMRFDADALPPAGAFWSVTMYDGEKFLVDNPLDRYLINSGMLDRLTTTDAGEIILYLQKDSPGPDLESNWLPAPDGEMGVVMRIYLPDASAIEGSWRPPAIEVAGDN